MIIFYKDIIILIYYISCKVKKNKLFHRYSVKDAVKDAVELPVHLLDTPYIKLNMGYVNLDIKIKIKTELKNKC